MCKSRLLYELNIDCKVDDSRKYHVLPLRDKTLSPLKTFTFENRTQKMLHALEMKSCTHKILVMHGCTSPNLACSQLLPCARYTSTSTTIVCRKPLNANLVKSEHCNAKSKSTSPLHGGGEHTLYSSPCENRDKIGHAQVAKIFLCTHYCMNAWEMKAP